MKKITILVCSAFVLFGCSPHEKAKKEEVIFFDDFSSDKLDKSKWNVRITGEVVNNELQAYVDSSNTIYIAKGKETEGSENGALVLKAIYSHDFVTKDGKKFDFISGRIDSKSKAEFTYGTISARIKLYEGSGLWPAFWALGSGSWPATGEIDIMEYIGEPDWTSAALHGPGYSGETPFVNRVYFDKKIDATQWHIYSVDWTPESLLFKVDGKLMYRITKTMVTHFGTWQFDNKKYLILNMAVGGAYPVKMNGIKNPHFGLVESTLQVIKENNGKMLVDWVKVTK